MDEQLLKQAMEMSMDAGVVRGVGGVTAPPGAQRDLSSLTEDEQIAYALQMSLQHGESNQTTSAVIK